ncbi:MAG: iron ABC transporter permease [Methanomassiliicoccales archaeon]
MMEGSATQRARRRLGLILIAGSVSLFALVIVYVSLGQVKLNFLESMSALIGYISKFGQPTSSLTKAEMIVGHIRLPRSIAVIGVGIGLAIAGAIMQAMIRNPLVDPYITGVSSGAAVGATLAMLFGITAVGLLAFAIPVAAFLGALMAFAFTMTLAEASGGRALNYVLAGVVTGTALASLVTLILSMSPDRLHGPIFWMWGSFNGVDWTQSILIIIPTMVMTAIALLYARELNVVLLGHEQAYQLGIDSQRFRRWMMVISCMLTAVAVAFVGIIGFLGLIVPHISRIIVGGDHRLLLPASIIIGANVLLLADIVSRTVMAAELPVGAIISLIGAPFFGYLLVRRGREYAG